MLQIPTLASLRVRGARLLVSLSLSLSFWLLISAAAQASDVFTLAKEENGYALGTYLGVLEDPSGKLSIKDVASGQQDSGFRSVDAKEPGFGFSESALWIRLTVRNIEEAPKLWFLELAYPHIDWVDLYVPKAGGGFEVRRTGDHRSFSQRDLEYRNFVFRLSEPGGESVRTYYLRIQTSGSMNIPLLAWSPEAFYRAQNQEQPVLWMFYGLMLVMAVYNLFIYASVRQVDYLYYSIYILSYTLFQFTLNGYTKQYLLPTQIWLSNQLLPAAIGSAYVWPLLFQRSYLSTRERLPNADKMIVGMAWAFGGLTVYGLFGSYEWAIRCLAYSGVFTTLFMFGVALYMAAQGQREAKLYLFAWGFFRIAIFLYAMRAAGALPNNFLTNWSMQIGASLETVLFSFALADRINTMRGSLAKLNVQLTQNVDDLRIALAKAEAATVAKSNFLATVSHELRTPLNSIINLPQALLLDLPQVSNAVCGACSSVFELEEGETLGADTACPDCAVSGSMRLVERRGFRGDPQEFAVHLGHIETSGKHLLQVVDGVLDFSRLEAQRLELRAETVKLRELVQEALSPLHVNAHAKRVDLKIEPVAAEAEITCDPLRVKQVLINLVSNAIKFTEGRGHVTVQIEEEPASYLFKVRDQGIGIAESDLPRLFRSFEQVHQGNTRKYGGTGLGLSISRSLVEMHGGEIWAESELGTGSVFQFRIPKHLARPNESGVHGKAREPSAAEAAGVTGEPSSVENDATAAATAYELADIVPFPRGSVSMKKVGNDPTSLSSSGARPIKPLQKERLLYVEDDDDNFRVAELRLRDGYELVRAADAEEACRRLSEGPWSAILMDIELRGSDLDGVELTKLFRGRLRKDTLPAYARGVEPVETPIIFVTAHGAKYTDAALMLVGAEKVITKPVDFGALNLALTQLHLTRARKGRTNA